MKSKIIPVIMAFILFALAARISPISVTNHEWSPTTPLTNDTLNCSWAYSADNTTIQNITILKNGALFYNASENASLVNLSSYYTISPENTTKNDIWACNITLCNYSDETSTSSEESVTIGNTPPTTESGDAGIFYEGAEIGYYFTVLEDTTYEIDVNATDADNDSIEYKLGEKFCTMTNEEQGLYSCAPTQSYLIDNNPTVTNISFTFWDPQNPGGRKVLFNITPVNDNPTFNTTLANQAISEGQVLNYMIYGSDEENNYPLNFTVNVSPSLGLYVNLTSNATAMIMIGEDNRPALYNESNNYTVNVTVYDNLSASTTSGFKLTISQVNAAIELREISNQSGTQGESFLFYVYADDPDENNTPAFDIITINCSLANPWSITTINNSHNATGLVNITTLNNDHVVCGHVNITVIDGEGAEDYQDVFLNISNTNDPPNVVVLSSYSNNTGGDNLSSLVAYASSSFIYLVNATDPDQLTLAGDILSFSGNSTFFDVDSSTGLISFTPNQSLIGNHTINITVTDSNLSSDSEDMHLEIRNNSAPVLDSIGNLSCAEDTSCLVIISATDNDAEDNLSFTSNDSDAFDITDNSSQNPVRGAYVNYEPGQELVGNHSIVVTVTDIRGAFDNETILLTINNTNDFPVLDTDNIIFPSVIVETHNVSLYVYADDNDYDLPSSYAYISVNGTNLTEYVNFSITNITGRSIASITTNLSASTNKTYGRITITPSDTDAGNYSVNITAIDYTGAINWTVMDFTVLANTSAPAITDITPYGRPYSNETLFNFTSTSNYDSSITSINVSENTSVVYNITVTDDGTAQENLTYSWLINGSLNSTSSYLEIDYGFLTQGTYNITVFVTDDTYENASWTWNLTVDNVNRGILLLNDLYNLSINSTETFSYYLKWVLEGNESTFIDPDDDLDSNDFLNANETSNLNFNITGCSVATITLVNNNDGIRVEPVEVGTCSVTFLAYDSSESTKTSNVVLINVTSVPTNEETEQAPRSGGGGGYSRSVITPITKQEEKPKAIELVVPNLVTIYENKTILIPVTIKNNWNSSLKEVRINATSNATGVKLKFTEDYFEELKAGSKRDIMLMADNYRLGENYEIKITANVTNPKTSDSALVLLNTIEQSKEGPEVETKVTFAQDLLRENPECLELNELLIKAKESLEKGATAEASKMVDGVIDGCKYLVGIAKKSEQKPQSAITKLINKENLKYLITFFGAAAVIILAILLMAKRRRASAKKEEEAKKKENKPDKQEELKPYWSGA